MTSIQSNFNLPMQMAKRWHSWVFVLFALFLTGCDQEVAGISPERASQLFAQQKTVIVDVRENDEWQEQHIEGAIHIPLGEVESRLTELAEYKDQDIVMQCRSGRRSAVAGQILMLAGFSKVHNLEGGILAWEKDGLATVKGTPVAAPK